MRDAAYLEWLLPRLRNGGYEITSDQADQPNCIGYALGSNLYFDPVAIGGWLAGYYWPPDIGDDYSVETSLRLFGLFRFQECDGGDLEPGMEKIAIYIGEDQETSHVALQLPSGEWTSKLNKLEDIRHRTLDELISPPEYMAVAKFMSRPRQGGN